VELDDLEVGSAEWEAEVERLQALDDAEQAAAKPATIQDEQQQAAGDDGKANDPEKPAEPAVAGVASKDGKTVLPYAALQGARRTASVERQHREAAETRAAQLEQELADLKAGKTPEPKAEPLTDEEIEDLRAMSPETAAKVTAERDARLAAEARVAELAAKVPAPAEGQPEASDDPIQDAIDAIPLLVQWQSSDPEKFARADALDAALLKSPKWGGHTPEALAKRYAQVTRLVAEEYDIQIPEPAPQTKEPSKSADEIVARAGRTAPNSLSDFKGGNVDQTEQRLERMPAVAQLARVSDMTPAQFAEYLDSLG
jgi:hypothetical protein